MLERMGLRKGSGGWREAALVLICHVCANAIAVRARNPEKEDINNPCGSHRAGDEVCVPTSQVGRPHDLEGMGRVTP